MNNEKATIKLSIGNIPQVYFKKVGSDLGMSGFMVEIFPFSQTIIPFSNRMVRFHPL